MLKNSTPSSITNRLKCSVRNFTNQMAVCSGILRRILYFDSVSYQQLMRCLNALALSMVLYEFTCGSTLDDVNTYTHILHTCKLTMMVMVMVMLMLMVMAEETTSQRSPSTSSCFPLPTSQARCTLDTPSPPQCRTQSLAGAGCPGKPACSPNLAVPTSSLAVHV
jgi:hypothetical protein